ncbi:MAG: dienelactone hydrolase family protein [Cyclobacteriaceae bacterium]|nr:dienelactone hydrolase family protein [Cyclobacteriaceae bacterium]
MDQHTINLFDGYTHKPLPRLIFLKNRVRLTDSTAVALSVQEGTPANTNKARELFGKLAAAKKMNNFIKGFESSCSFLWPPAATDVPKIKAFMQAYYGGLDERINADIIAYEAALKAAITRYEIFIYEGAPYAFNNDTAPTRYNEAAAKFA